MQGTILPHEQESQEQKNVKPIIIQLRQEVTSFISRDFMRLRNVGSRPQALCRVLRRPLLPYKHKEAGKCLRAAHIVEAKKISLGRRLRVEGWE